MGIGALIFNLFVSNTLLLAQSGGHNHSAPATKAQPASTSLPSQKSSPKEPTKKEEPRVPVEVAQTQQAKMGLKVATVSKKKVEHTIRAAGTVTADQTKEAHVHTRINGWIEEVFADYIGKEVKKKQPLYSLYSPDLVSTQEEYISARNQGGIGKEISRAALERLRLWSVPESEIKRLTETGKAKRAITFDAPVDGVIVNKTAIKGMYVTPEMELYYIANLEKVWIVVSLYEYDLATIAVGDVAKIQLPYDPTKNLSGKISYIYPEVEIETRTAKARIEMPNMDQKLKPGMFANIEIEKSLGDSLVVPDEAVIDTGVRKIIFVKASPTRFEPREIKVGPRVGNDFIVTSGLKDKEEVVVSAHFLIDTESKLQAALQRGDSSTPGHGSHGK